MSWRLVTIGNQEKNRKLEAKASRKKQLCRRPCLESPFLLFVNTLFRARDLLSNLGVEGALLGETLASCALTGGPVVEPTADTGLCAPSGLHTRGCPYSSRPRYGPRPFPE